jgi:hypothetical protein
VFRIARNVCLMQRRKSVFAPAHELSLDELPPSDEVPDSARAPEGEMLRSELRAVIDRVIVELPPSYRAVVLLRDLEELTTEETAHILDLGIDVVKTRLHRGRAAPETRLLPEQPLPRRPAQPQSGAPDLRRATRPLCNLGKERRRAWTGDLSHSVAIFDSLVLN